MWLPGEVVEVAVVDDAWTVRHWQIYYINNVQTLRIDKI